MYNQLIVIVSGSTIHDIVTDSSELSTRTQASEPLIILAYVGFIGHLMILPSFTSCNLTIGYRSL